jgi:SAM-dependent methyltransferase
MSNLLEEFCRKVGVKASLKEEYTLAVGGRADAVFDRLVIEYKRPGVLKKPMDKSTQEAVRQLEGYLERMARERHRPLRELAGVVLDGRYVIFVRHSGSQWIEEEPWKVNKHSVRRLLSWLMGLASGKALTAENLYRDFSLEQPHTQNILRAFFTALGPALAQESLVQKLFHQWRLFFSEAIDYAEAFGGRKLGALRKWAGKAGFDIKDTEDAERFFFVLHTYFALFLKLLAWLALSRYLGVKVGTLSFGKLRTANSRTLRRMLREMESGGIFRQYGLLNLLEGDFFTWYLYVWNPPIERAVRGLIEQLDQYDPTTLSVLPEETRDLFKKLYHYLLPREIRHNLGEYYTPDWLAQYLLRQVDEEFFTADPRQAKFTLRRKLFEKRFLDPACGSGTFLVLTIARFIELGQTPSISKRHLLQAILRNVVGFDLNPLAVLTARVNYLLAIADLLEYRDDDITIPVYLADSVRTPAMGEELLNEDTFIFPTAVGKFQVPSLLAKPWRFDRLCEIIEECLELGDSVEEFVAQLESELYLASDSEWDEKAKKLTRTLYETMWDLHQRKLNGLWARLLKNNFAPLTLGEFDYIVGNPPWINWEHLPEKYRESTRPLWTRYGLAGTSKGGRSRLGAVKVDISALMTYTVVDTLLKKGGRLGFVVTQSLFKTAAGAGFRSFQILRPAPLPGRSNPPSGPIPLRVIRVDDLVKLQPFEGASNRTALLVLEKGTPTCYPVRYFRWRKKGKKRFTYDSPLEDVLSATQRLEWVAEPVNYPHDPTSPWLTVPPTTLQALRNKVLGKSVYVAHEGVNTGGANAVYWVKIGGKRPDGLVLVRNITKGAKVKVPKVTRAVESDLLYPLLRGRDVQRWQAKPSAYIIVPYAHTPKLAVIPITDMKKDYPRTYAYLKPFEPILRARADAMVKSALRRGEPFYFYGGVGSYTFARWKVVWPWISKGIRAAVVGSFGGKLVMPEHNTFFVACDILEEALYICALLNSSVGDFAIRSFFSTGGGGIGTAMVLNYIRIPSFDPKNPVHRRLAALSMRAHKVAKRGKGAHKAAKGGKARVLRRIEARIDRVAARVWGLSRAELKEIQQTLRELLD